PAQLVQEVFDLEAAAATAPSASSAAVPSALLPRWNIAPTQEAAVVRRGERGERRLDLLRWGLVPPRAATPAGHINARGETVASLAAFRDSFRARRCLVPADGFYEWQHVAGRAQPYHIRFRDRRLFAMA